MSEKGWAVMDRSILDHWLWDDKPFSKGQAWLDLVLLAKHKDQKFYYDGKLVDGKRGTVYWSLKALSERWGWDRKKTRRFMDALKVDGMVTVNDPTDGTTNRPTHGTTITIVNYGKYQNVGTTNRPTDNPTDNPTEGQPRDNRGTTAPHIQQCNNDNNVNKDIVYGYNSTSTGKVLGIGYNSTIGQPTIQQYREVRELWNEIPHALKIDEIIPGTRREGEVRIVIDMYGYDGLKRAIQSVKDSAYLRRRGHVQFDNYINRNVVQKLLEGSYNEDYGMKQSGGCDELTIDWGSAEPDYNTLSTIPE